jgi:peptidoglycan/LPS O-acetylase OafA/YrhL
VTLPTGGFARFASRRAIVASPLPDNAASDAWRYRPELDGLRGVAILIVLAAHTRVPGFAIEGGLAGVTLFFALSGYLITNLLVTELAGGSISIRRFYARRALRLLPALAALLLAVSVGYSVGMWPARPIDLPAAVASTILYVANWAQIAGVQTGVLSHTWSLAIEEQFYIVWPIMLMLSARYIGLRGLATVALIVVGLVTPWRVFLALSDGPGRVFAGTDGHIDALLLGCIVAIARLHLSAAAGWAALAVVVACGAIWVPGGGLLFMLPLATVASAVAVAACPRILGWAPLATIGRISYGLYLWHYLLIWSELPLVVVWAGTFAIAATSYAVIERPFLRIKQRLLVPRPSM